MEGKVVHHWTPSSIKWRFLIVVLLVLGLFFRFVNLDRKVYWFDETYTSLRISGYRDRQVVEQVFDGRVISIEDLHKYQRVNPEKSVINTVQSLVKEDPHHPPLYYIIARIWAGWFGDSVAIVRSLSVILSLVLFPSIYWLCLELFASPLVGWITVALIAISPFHVLYAQEARQYGWWSATILLASAALLRAMRLKTKLSWGIYAAAIVVGLYTYIFTSFVALGHASYVAIIERFRLTKVSVAYLLASLAVIIAYLPWILVLIAGALQIEDTTVQVRRAVPLLRLAKAWVTRTGYAFVDFQPYSEATNLTPLLFFQFVLALCALFLFIYSLYFLCRNTPKSVWLFSLTLIASSVLPLLLPDLIFGGSRSTNNRYLSPYFLAVQLSVAFLLANRINSSSLKNWQRTMWQLITLVVFSSGLLSCVISSQAVVWWNKGGTYHIPEIAKIINQAQKPLVVSDHRTNYQDNVVGEIMSLTYRLDPKVKLQLVVQPNIPKIPKGFSDVFLFNPSDTLRNGLEKEQSYRIEPLYERQDPLPASLWKLRKVKTVSHVNNNVTHVA
jgi:uncharacterized membrane protein